MGLAGLGAGTEEPQDKAPLWEALDGSGFSLSLTKLHCRGSPHLKPPPSLSRDQLAEHLWMMLEEEALRLSVRLVFNKNNHYPTTPHAPACAACQQDTSGTQGEHLVSRHGVEGGEGSAPG